MSVAVVLGLLASGLSILSPIPQILRAVRSRSADGISWNSLLLSVMTVTLWVVYGVAVADAIQIINNVLGLVLLGVLGLAVVRAGVERPLWTAAAVMFISAAVSILVVDRASSLTLAMVGTLASTCRLVPQARLAVSGASLWGLCPCSTLLAWLGLLAWTAYGVAAGDHGVTLCSAVAAALQFAIVVYRLPPRRTLDSLAGGRLGPSVARLAAPASARFPYRDGYELAA